MFSTSLCSVASFALITFGDNRVGESIKLASLSVVMTGVALAAIIFDGYLTTAEEFRDYLWLAAADIIGTVVGIMIAIGAFAIVIWTYEKSLPPPKNSLPPSDEEIKHVVELATSHIGGGEE